MAIYFKLHLIFEHFGHKCFLYKVMTTVLLIDRDYYITNDFNCEIVYFFLTNESMS